MTGGGKTDATVKVWGQRQWGAEGASRVEGDEDGEGGASSGGERQTNGAPLILAAEDGRTLSKPGYSFDLEVLPDLKPGSSLFALAAARYNTVKIVL